MKLAIILSSLIIMGSFAHAEEGHVDLATACKKECPAAQTEEEADKCMDKLSKEKKADKKFRKTDCFAAYKEHKEHESKAGHSH